MEFLVNCVMRLSSNNELMSFIFAGWSKHVQDIALAMTTFYVWTIWHCRNNKCLNNKAISFESLSSGSNLESRSHFSSHLEPLLHGWVKYNSDSSTNGFPCLADCDNIFRDHSANCVGCYSRNLGINNSFFAKLMGTILAIEIAFNRGGLMNLWL
ncbi:hypothetical protein HKD37_15G041758 [Glycine soja]